VGKFEWHVRECGSVFPRSVFRRSTFRKSVFGRSMSRVLKVWRMTMTKDPKI